MSREDGQADPRAVAVAYGQDTEAKHAVFTFLRTIGLRPLEWEQLIARTHSAAPYSGEAVDRGFATARAVIILFTPDDVVRLHRGLGGNGALELQARANVLLEAGMALATHPNRTVLVQIGSTRIPSNLAGRNLVRLDGSVDGLNTLVNRLERCGCDVDRTGDWHDPAPFAELAALVRTPDDVAPAPS